MINDDRQQAVLFCKNAASRHGHYNERVFRIWAASAFVTLLASGCAAISPTGVASPTLSFVTATLPATPSATSTAQPATRAPSPTSPPISGLTSTQLYVRGEPSSASAPLGLLAAAITVQVIGRDADGNWYQIAYAGASDGKGWVSAQYVHVDDQAAIPVIGGAGSGPSGSITQQVNVRKGPSPDEDSLGTLNQRDVVILTGRSSDSAWLQIQYGAGPDGKGWVAAPYVQATGVDSLPIVASTGAVVGTATSTAIAATPLPTVIPAIQDNDSAAAPAVNIGLSPSGVGAFIYSNDVSVPSGDTTDWIGFTPSEPAVSFSLVCAGNGNLRTDLMRGDQAPQDWTGLACGETKIVSLVPRQAYLLRLDAIPVGAQLQYVRYTLSISNAP